MNLAKWIDDRLEETLLIVIVLCIIVVMTLQVFMRKVLHQPLIWPEELCRYLFLWSGYISIGFCFKHGLHLKIDFFMKKFSQKTQKFFGILGQVIIFCFLIYILYSSVLVFGKVSQFHQKSPALNIPMSVIYFAPVFGYGLGILRFLQHLITNKR